MWSRCLRRALPVLAFVGVCVWSGVPSYSAEIPASLGESLPWLADLAADEASQVREILAEHLGRLSSLEGRPDAIRQMQALQSETLEKLAAVLTPERLAQFHASMPSFLLNDRLGKSRVVSESVATEAAASPAACSDGYDSIYAGLANAAFACQDGYYDCALHGPDPNPYSCSEYNTNCSARNAASTAEYLAYLALNDCTYADDAASAARSAAAKAYTGSLKAQQSEDYCWLVLGHSNPYAYAAAVDAAYAGAYLEQGANFEDACVACCITLSAPTGLHATATSATSIRLTWQDTNTKETNTKIERSTNAAAWEEIASVGANDTDHVDTAAASTGGHKYKVRAFNSNCNILSPYSALALVPKAPTDLTGTKGTGDKFILTWIDRSGGINEDGFEIQRRIGTGSWESNFKRVGADIETTPVTLVAGVNRFRVRAYTTTGETWFTNIVSYTY